MILILVFNEYAGVVARVEGLSSQLCFGDVTQRGRIAESTRHPATNAEAGVVGLFTEKKGKEIVDFSNQLAI